MEKGDRGVGQGVRTRVDVKSGAWSIMTGLAVSGDIKVFRGMISKH